ALTPVATLMFRFNNPDALLTLLLVAAAYATTRAIEHGSTRWLVLAGALVGVGFLAKMLQAILVVPGFALAYLVAGPTPLRRRLRCAAGCCSCSVPAWPWSPPPAGGWRSSSCGRPAPARTSAARSTTACSS